MFLRYPYGNEAWNNSQIRKEGELSIVYPEDESELPAVRIHDGETPGGWEAVATGRAEIPVPGPPSLQAGDATAGFYGEVPTDNLIDGASLASEIGLSAGTAQNSDSPWLKFASQGKTLFVAKKNYRYGISWDDIDAVNAVYGTTEVTIGTNTYRVRLLTGSDTDPESGPGGEWNALFYPIHQDDPNDQGWGVNYTDAEINVGTGAGRGTWHQETSADDAGYRVFRGGSSVTAFNTWTSSVGNSPNGWRPCLELVT